MRRRWRWTAIAGVALAALAGSFIFAMDPLWRNDERLNALRQRIVAYPLPPETELFDSEESFGRLNHDLVGHCEYRVRVTLYTGLSEDKIRAYYGNAKIAGLDDDIPIYLWFQDSPYPGWRPFIIEVVDAHLKNGDWRCT